MRHVRIMGLCLIAAFAFAAIGSASASAGPVPAFWECAAAKKETVTYKKGTKTLTKTVNTGNEKNSTCSKPYTKDKVRKFGPHPGPEGPYQLQEWAKEPSAVKKFTGTSGTAFLEIVGLGPINCHAGTGSGQITGPQTVGGIQVTFTGCELNGHKCNTPGAAAEEIRTNTLQGKLGFFDEKFKKAVTQGVGLDVYPEGSAYDAENVECASILLHVEGSVIGEIVPPYNVFTTTFKGKYEESAGAQAIQSFEGEPKDTLLTELWQGKNWGIPTESGQSGELTTTGEDVEIKT